MRSNDIVPIAGFPVKKTTAFELAAYLLEKVRNDEKAALFFANTNFIVRCRHLLEQMKDGAVTIVNDGVGMDIAARLVRAGAFAENLNGTDFTPYFLAQSGRPMRVFMLGAQPAVLARAVEHARHALRQTVVGQCDGYEGMRSRPDLIDMVNGARAEIVLVALGNPHQEEWILANRRALHANVVIGVGALFDFWGGGKPRAPRLVRRLRLEWLYRLCLEPRRLVRRYTVDIVKFLILCRKHRQSARRY